MALVEPGTVVLVVDDDRDVRNGIVDLLTMEGYEPRPAASADAAWKAITSGVKPAAIVLDAWLPGMSSGELVRRLRASPQAHVPVVVLTASRPNERIGVEGDVTCQKHGDLTTLVRAIDKLVNRRPGPAGRRRARGTKQDEEG